MLSIFQHLWGPDNPGVLDVKCYSPFCSLSIKSGI